MKGNSRRRSRKQRRTYSAGLEEKIVVVERARSPRRRQRSDERERNHSRRREEETVVVERTRSPRRRRRSDELERSHSRRREGIVVVERARSPRRRRSHSRRRDISPSLIERLAEPVATAAIGLMEKRFSPQPAPTFYGMPQPAPAFQRMPPPPHAFHGMMPPAASQGIPPPYPGENAEYRRGPAPPRRPVPSGPKDPVAFQNENETTNQSESRLEKSLHRQHNHRLNGTSQAKKGNSGLKPIGSRPEGQINAYSDSGDEHAIDDFGKLDDLLAPRAKERASERHLPKAVHRTTERQRQRLDEFDRRLGAGSTSVNGPEIIRITEARRQPAADYDDAYDSSRSFEVHRSDPYRSHSRRAESAYLTAADPGPYPSAPASMPSRRWDRERSIRRSYNSEMPLDERDSYSYGPSPPAHGLRGSGVLRSYSSESPYMRSYGSVRVPSALRLDNKLHWEDPEPRDILSRRMADGYYPRDPFEPLSRRATVEDSHLDRSEVPSLAYLRGYEEGQRRLETDRRLIEWRDRLRGQRDAEMVLW